MGKRSRFSNSLRRFGRNESGNFGMMMGFMAFPLIGATALAVDYSMVEKERTQIQTSLDAAALAATKELGSGVNEDSFKAYAKQYFEATLPSNIDPKKVMMSASIATEIKKDKNGIDYTEKSVKLDATINHQTFFANAIGLSDIASQLTSQVAMGNLTVEIALVIDNSGSMASSSRMTRAKSTSKSLVDQIFAAGAVSNKPNPVSFSLVPFAASVNVGPGNKNANWMDTKGWSTTHNQYLDWSTYTPKPGHTMNIENKGSHRIAFEHKVGNPNDGSWKSRFDIFDMLGENWKGCVEMRPWPHNTQDTFQSNGESYSSMAAKTSGAGLDALFNPLWEPAEPLSYYYVKTKWGDDFRWDDHDYYNSYVLDWYDGNGNFFYGDASTTGANQHKRQSWIGRYQANKKYTYYYKNIGPQSACTTKPLTALTTNKDTIKAAIDDMAPNGNTNVQEGIAWGWRTLSPAEPLTGGRSRDDVDNRKYVIVLTDGNNTYSAINTPNQTTYAAWGFGKDGRIDEGLSKADRPKLYENLTPANWEQKMNVHTLQTCENARKDGITIFSIAFDVPNGSSVKSLLEACAGSGLDTGGNQWYASGEFYFDVSGSQIEAAMAAIAAQISEMRVTR